MHRPEQVRWNGSLAIALLIHVLALYGLILMTWPHQPAETGVTEVELIYVEPPRPPTQDEQTSAQEPAELLPAPTPASLTAPPPANPSAAPLPVQNNGFAMTAGPMLATAPSSTQAPPTPTARLAPLIITPGSPHDARRLPAYPPEARSKAEQGDVLVEVKLDPDGSVRGTRIVESSGHARLDAAALQSARMLRFRPPRPPPGVVLRNAIFVEVPFSFRLE